MSIPSGPGLEHRGRPVGPGSFHWVVSEEMRKETDRLYLAAWAEAVERSMTEIIAQEINRALDRIDGAVMFADALGESVAPWQRNLFVSAVVTTRANEAAAYADRSRYFRPRAEAAARRIAAELTDAGHAQGWLLPGHRFDWSGHDAHA